MRKIIRMVMADEDGAFDIEDDEQIVHADSEQGRVYVFLVRDEREYEAEWRR